MMKPILTIEYCTQCRWLMRSAWFAQELLTTFQDELGGVTLIPAAGGLFRVKTGDKVLWDRKEKNGFPEITELKQIVRDALFPEKSLGHSDKKAL